MQIMKYIFDPVAEKELNEAIDSMNVRMALG